MRHGCASGVMLLLLGTVGAQGAAPPTRNHWTLLFYGAGADEKHVLKTVGVMKDHFVDGQGVELIALINRPGKYADASKVLGDDFAGTRVFRVTRGRATRLTAPFAAGVKTAEPTTLQKFIRFARANHPAQRYALIFFGHGNGWRFCPDKESGTALQPTAVSAALGRDDSVDLVVFDVCFMGGIEVAYQWRPGNGRFQASAMVAAPGLGDALPYDAILSRLHSGGLAPARLTPLALGKQIVADTDAHRRREIVREPMYASEVLACYDLSRAAAVKEAVDALAVELSRAEGARAALEKVRGSGKKPVAMNYLDPEGVEPGWAWLAVPYFDLYDLARRVRASPDFPAAIKDKAAGVQRAVGRLIVGSFGQKAYPGFEPGKNGLYITFPDGAALTRRSGTGSIADGTRR